MPISKDDTLQFMGFFEGILSLRVPQWWKDGVVTSEVSPVRKAITPFASIQTEEPKNPFVQVDRQYWVMRGHTFVVQVKPKYHLVSETSTFVIPELILDRFLEKWKATKHIYVVAAQKDASSYVLLLHGPFAESYQLYLVDNDGQEILWKSEVWTENCLVPGRTGGLPRHWTEAILRNGEAVVFGLCENSAYIEGFDLSDGTNKWRFSTSY